MNLLFKKNKQNQLTVLISETEIIYFSKKDKLRKSILIDASDSFNYTDNLINLIDQKVLKDINEDQLIQFYFIDENFVLVPNELFDPDLSEDYLNLIAPVFNYNLVLNSRTEVLHSTIVFSIFKDVEFFIQKRLTNYSFNHIGINSLNKVISKNKNEEVNCIFYNNYAEIILTMNKKTIYYNIINFDDLTDLLKEIITKVEFYEFDINKLKIKLLNGKVEYKKFFETYFRHIDQQKIDLFSKN